MLGAALGLSPTIVAVVPTRLPCGCATRPSTTCSKRRSSATPTAALPGKPRPDTNWAQGKTYIYRNRFDRRHPGAHQEGDDDEHDDHHGAAPHGLAPLSKLDELKLRRAQQQQQTQTPKSPRDYQRPATSMPMPSVSSSLPPATPTPSSSPACSPPFSVSPSSTETDESGFITFNNVAELRRVLQFGAASGPPPVPPPPPPPNSTSSSSPAATAAAAPQPSWRRMGGPGGPPAPLEPSQSPGGGAEETARRRGPGAAGPAVIGDHAGGVAEDDAAAGERGYHGDSRGSGSGGGDAAPGSSQFVLDPEMEESADFQQAKRYALSALQRAPLASVDLARRLQARGHPPATAAALVGWLRAAGALDDRLFARLYTRSKWSSGLAAPSKIRKDLAALGVAPAHITAGLAHVFGPACRINLSGAATAEEKEVREALLAAARRHVEQRSGAYLRSRQRGEGGGGGRGGDDTEENWSSAASAQAKDREASKRRLATWLQYRGHDMALVLQVFKHFKL